MSDSNEVAIRILLFESQKIGLLFDSLSLWHCNYINNLKYIRYLRNII